MMYKEMECMSMLEMIFNVGICVYILNLIVAGVWYTVPSTNKWVHPEAVKANLISSPICIIIFGTLKYFL